MEIWDILIERIYMILLLKGIQKYNVFHIFVEHVYNIAYLLLMM